MAGIAGTAQGKGFDRAVCHVSRYLVFYQDGGLRNHQRGVVPKNFYALYALSIFKKIQMLGEKFFHHYRVGDGIIVHVSRV